MSSKRHHISLRTDDRKSPPLPTALPPPPPERSPPSRRLPSAPAPPPAALRGEGEPGRRRGDGFGSPGEWGSARRSPGREGGPDLPAPPSPAC